MDAAQTLWTTLNHYAAGLFVAGLVLAIIWNWLQWQQDRALALRLRTKSQQSMPLIPRHSVRSEEPRDDNGETLPKVSVLVAAWNEADIIREHIQSFLGLHYPNKELILCAGGEDGTYRIAREQGHTKVKVLEQQRGEGKQRALQRCWEQATGEVIFLTDADCLLDDAAFNQTLAPVLQAGEHAATGTSRPLEEQLRTPFVVYQWCTDLFVSARRPEFIAGLLGRNCALQRTPLEQIGGFATNVPTGTDYHTAKLLLRAGYRIRYVRDSAIRTRYPATFRSYWRRQSRWVRNLLLHGLRFGAYDEVWQALRTSLAGWTMLLLPFLALAAGPLFLAIWAVLLVHALLSRLRYARFAHLYQGIAMGGKQCLLLPLYMFVDFIAWAMPLMDLLMRRHKW